jgi:hypothetical protein
LAEVAVIGMFQLVDRLAEHRHVPAEPDNKRLKNPACSAHTDQALPPE